MRVNFKAEPLNQSNDAVITPITQLWNYTNNHLTAFIFVLSRRQTGNMLTSEESRCLYSPVDWHIVPV